MQVPLKAIFYHLNWANPDKGRMREELAQIAERGLTHVYLSPPWFRLQPRPHRVDRMVMATLEACYDAAEWAGMAAVTSVLTAGYAGMRELPDWHTSDDVMELLQGRTQAPVFRRDTQVYINGVRRGVVLANPYIPDTFRYGQHELIRAVMGYFDGHPAARHWLLAPGWSYLGRTDRKVAYAWWQEITSIARRVHTGAVLMAQVDKPQLLGHSFDLEMMSREVDMIVVDTAMTIVSHRHTHAPMVPMQFLAYVVAGLTQCPTVIGMHPIERGTGVAWQSKTWYEGSLMVPELADEQLVDAWMQLLDGWKRTNIAGVVYPIGWHWGADDDRRIAAPDYHRLAPLMTQLDAGLRQWQQVGTQREQLDAERYWYEPFYEIIRLWNEFTRAK